MSPKKASSDPIRPFWLGTVWHETWKSLITVGLGIGAALIISPLIQDILTAPTCDDPSGLELVQRDELRAEATSTLAQDDEASYEAGRAIDGDSSTAWVEGIPEEDEKKYGENETLTIWLADARDVQLICMINGYTSTQNSYLRNARVRQLIVTTYANKADSVLPEKPLEFYDDYQSINFVKGVTKSIALTIGTARAGQTFDRVPDTSISEVEIWANPN